MKRWALSAWLLLSASAPCVVDAAGFDCARAASASEKAICANARLSRADDTLAAAWRRALDDGGDNAARKAAQRAWLEQRDACGSDVACLDTRYRERLAALGATQPADAAAFRWQRTWQRTSVAPGVGATLKIDGALPDLSFALDGLNGANSGNLEGTISVRDGHATFADKTGCRLDFTQTGDRIVVKQASRSDCGAGAGVDYRGEYVTEAAAKAAPAKQTLATLGVVADAAADRAARALLGDRDYRALIGSCNVVAETDDLDHLGAKSTECFVRGVANTNAAIVVSKHAQLWIGLLVFAPDDRLRMRYYTNVTASKPAMPATIRRWLDDKQAANAAVGSTTPLVIPIDRQP